MSDPKSPEKDGEKATVAPAKEKRKLRLMNEVLPAPSPRAASARESAEAALSPIKSPRERTLSRMQTLIVRSGGASLVSAAAMISASATACKTSGSNADGGAARADSVGDKSALATDAGALAYDADDANDAGRSAAGGGRRADSSGDAGADASVDAGTDGGADAGGKKAHRALPPRKDPGYMVVDMLPEPPSLRSSNPSSPYILPPPGTGTPGTGSGK